MTLSVDSAALIMPAIGRELRSYEDYLALLGIYYVGKITASITLSLYRGIREHVITKFYPYNVDLANRYGQWAMVVGGLQNYGRAFAEELAKRGCNVVLLDYSKEDLEQLARELENQFDVYATTHEIDLRRSDIDFSEIGKIMRTKDVGILVNAFEVSAPPTLLETTAFEALEQMISGNVRSFTWLTTHALRHMTIRNRGVIINLSSAIIDPVPHFAVYVASKAYMEVVFEALNLECCGRDIIIQTFAPMRIYPDTRSGKEYPFPILSEAEYAKNALNSLGLYPRITGYWFYSFQLWVYKQIPKYVRDYVTSTTVQSRNIHSTGDD